MPWAPKRPCSWPGCPELTDTGWCGEHRRRERRQSGRQYDQAQRDRDAKRFYNSSLWKRAREAKLSRDPLCEMDCREQGWVTRATIVHHRDGDVRNLEEGNLQSACAGCHSRHEDRRRGGFKPGVGRVV
jgi:5-methylcytosine-specific restriction protein A